MDEELLQERLNKAHQVLRYWVKEKEELNRRRDATRRFQLKKPLFRLLNELAFGVEEDKYTLPPLIDNIRTFEAEIAGVQGEVDKLRRTASRLNPEVRDKTQLVGPGTKVTNTKPSTPVAQTSPALLSYPEIQDNPRLIVCLPFRNWEKLRRPITGRVTLILERPAPVAQKASKLPANPEIQPQTGLIGRLPFRNVDQLTRPDTGTTKPKPSAPVAQRPSAPLSGSEIQYRPRLKLVCTPRAQGNQSQPVAPKEAAVQQDVPRAQGNQSQPVAPKEAAVQQDVPRAQGDQSQPVAPKEATIQQDVPHAQGNQSQPVAPKEATIQQGVPSLPENNTRQPKRQNQHRGDAPKRPTDDKKISEASTLLKERDPLETEPFGHQYKQVTKALVQNRFPSASPPDSALPENLPEKHPSIAKSLENQAIIAAGVRTYQLRKQKIDHEQSEVQQKIDQIIGQASQRTSTEQASKASVEMDAHAIESRNSSGSGKKTVEDKESEGEAPGEPEAQRPVPGRKPSEVATKERLANFDDRLEVARKLRGLIAKHGVSAVLRSIDDANQLRNLVKEREGIIEDKICREAQAEEKHRKELQEKDRIIEDAILREAQAEKKHQDEIKEKDRIIRDMETGRAQARRAHRQELEKREQVIRDKTIEAAEAEKRYQQNLLVKGRIIRKETLGALQAEKTQQREMAAAKLKVEKLTTENSKIGLDHAISEQRLIRTTTELRYVIIDLDTVWSQLRDATAQLEQKDMQLERIQAQLLPKIALLEKGNLQLHRQMTGLEQERAHAQRRCAHLEQQLDRLEQTYVDLQNRYATLEQTNEELKKVNENVIEENRTLTRTIDRTLTPFIAKTQNLKHQNKTTHQARQAFLAG